jgi:transposase
MRQEVAMDIVHPRVAGIDVHKKVIWVAVRLSGRAPGERTVTVRRFLTSWRSLQQMAAWLAQLGVTDAAMESTGVYWWPVYHALAGAGIEVCVCNAAHMRNVPGRKTDLRDCQWIAELHEHGLLRPSFIPAAEVAALRQRTRYRKKLIEQRTSELQRLAKVLEDGGVKIDSVASTLTTVSARDMVEALIAGERDPAVLAALARGVMRKKIPELEMACDGRFTAAHAQMCRLHLDGYDHLGAQIAVLDQLVAEAAAPFQQLIARLMTIPGIGRRTAEVIVAENGGDIARFATPARPAAWAGLAPGDNESAGKRKKAAARHGNQHLRAAMTESAWTVGRTATRPGARFRRLARRFGRGNEKKAAIAVAHTLLCIAWAVMKHDQDYAEAGTDYYDRRDARNHDHLVRHHQQAQPGLATRSRSSHPATAARHQPRPPDPAPSSPGKGPSRPRRRHRAPAKVPKFRYSRGRRYEMCGSQLGQTVGRVVGGVPGWRCRGVVPPDWQVTSPGQGFQGIARLPSGR